MRKSLSILILLAIPVAAYLFWSYWSASDEAEVLRTATVTRGTVEETVLASGVIEAKQLVSVGARVSGQIETLAVTLGQEVAAGDTIAQIDSQDQQNELLQAEADLANIEAQIAAKRASLRKAELILQREEELVAKELVAQQDVESAISDMLVLKAELGALDAQKSKAEVTVSTASLALERTTITAPIGGTVVAVVVDEGQTVSAANTAPTIVKLANLDTMVVKAEISEADVVYVHEGQDVTFTILGEPDYAFTAVVRAVEPAPAEIETSDTISTDEAIYYNGLLDVENPEHTLRIGMTTQVSIILDRATDVLTVPAAALQTTPQGQTVELFDPATGTATSTPVEVGLNDGVTAEINAGLTEGDQVVIGTTVTAASASSDRMGPPMGF